MGAHAEIRTGSYFMPFGSPRYRVGLPEPCDFPGAHPPHLPTPGAASPGGRLVSERSCTPSTSASCAGAPPPLRPAPPPLHLHVQERPPLFLFIPYLLGLLCLRTAPPWRQHHRVLSEIPICRRAPSSAVSTSSSSSVLVSSNPPSPLLQRYGCSIS